MRNIKSFDKFNLISENKEGDIQNYMFFTNLQTIKRLVDDMLDMDEKEVDEMLTNGHNWALDHMATSKDDVEEVYNFLRGNKDKEESSQNIKEFIDFNEDLDYDDDDDKKPIGINNIVEGINGLVCIFSPLESDMVDDWNSDKTIQKWVKEERVFLKEEKNDEWSIYGNENDNKLKSYIMKNYSW